jgi:hypothetical protein
MGLAKSSTASPFVVLQDNSLPELADWSTSGLSFIHLVYWFVAVVCAVFLAKRPLSRSDRLAIGMFEMRS